MCTLPSTLSRQTDLSVALARGCVEGREPPGGSRPSIGQTHLPPEFPSLGVPTRRGQVIKILENGFGSGPRRTTLELPYSITAEQNCRTTLRYRDLTLGTSSVTYSDGRRLNWHADRVGC